MSKKPVQEEEGGEKAPLWYISFADMISLLMAFFVMLQTMAAEHSNEAMTTGRGEFQVLAKGFRQKIDSFGLPELFGKEDENRSFNAPEKRYYFEAPENESAVVDPATWGDAEKMKHLFSTLSQSAKTEPPQVSGKVQGCTYIPVKFVDGRSQIDPTTTELLDRYISSAEYASASDDTLIYYVVGSAPEMTSLPEQWVVSEQRARSVADYLRNALPQPLRERVYWWGAGAGKSWFPQTEDVENQEHIMVVTLSSHKR